MRNPRSISHKTRWTVLKRDGFKCTYCGAAGVELVIDHAVSVADGGSGEDGNLRTACVSCNAGKGPESVGFVPPEPKPEHMRDSAEHYRDMDANITCLVETGQFMLKKYKEELYRLHPTEFMVTVSEALSYAILEDRLKDGHKLLPAWVLAAKGNGVDPNALVPYLEYCALVKRVREDIATEREGAHGR